MPVAVDLVAMEFPTLYRHHSIINVKISTPIKPQFEVGKFYSYMRIRGRLIVKMVLVIMTTPSVDARFLLDSFCIQMPAAFFFQTNTELGLRTRLTNSKSCM